jgi:hypothetical protein
MNTLHALWTALGQWGFANVSPPFLNALILLLLALGLCWLCSDEISFIILCFAVLLCLLHAPWSLQVLLLLCLSKRSPY